MENLQSDGKFDFSFSSPPFYTFSSSLSFHPRARFEERVPAVEAAGSLFVFFAATAGTAAFLAAAGFFAAAAVAFGASAAAVFAVAVLAFFAGTASAAAAAFAGQDFYG